MQVLAWQSLGWKIADIIKEYDDKKSIKGNSDRKMLKKYFTGDKIAWFNLFRRVCLRAKDIMIFAIRLNPIH